MATIEQLNVFAGRECVTLERSRLRAVRIVEFSQKGNLIYGLLESVSPHGLTLEGQEDERSVKEWWDISKYGWKTGERSDIACAKEHVHCGAAYVVFAHPMMSHTELLFEPDLVDRIKNQDNSGWREYFAERVRLYMEQRARSRALHDSLGEPPGG